MNYVKKNILNLCWIWKIIVNKIISTLHYYSDYNNTILKELQRNTKAAKKVVKRVRFPEHKKIIGLEKTFHYHKLLKTQ